MGSSQVNPVSHDLKRRVPRSWSLRHGRVTWGCAAPITRLCRRLQRGFAADQSSRLAPRLSFFVAEASSLRTFYSAAGSRSYGLCYAVFDLQKLTAALRDDSRIAAGLNWRLKPPLDHKVNGNPAFFLRNEKATFAEIMKLDLKNSTSTGEQVQNRGTTV